MYSSLLKNLLFSDCFTQGALEVPINEEKDFFFGLEGPIMVNREHPR